MPDPYLLDKIEHLGWMLRNLHDTKLESAGRPRTCIVWPDGSSLGLGWAVNRSGDAGGFKKLGFKGYADFYKLSKTKRLRYLKEALPVYRKIFWRYRMLSDDELDTKLDILTESLKKIADKHNKR